MEKINELLLQVKYQKGIRLNWQGIADEVGVSVETLRKLRFDGFYDGLRWEQIQRLAKLLGVKTWELIKLVEEAEADERRWDESFAGSQDALAYLADEALAEYEQGKTQILDPEKL